MLSIMVDGVPTAGASGLRHHHAASDWIKGIDESSRRPGKICIRLR